MTEKRFRVFKYSDDSNMYGVSDDQAKYTVAYFDNAIEAENLCQFLNFNEHLKETYMKDSIRLAKENQSIKRTIKDMIETERTELGRSVLKQLWEQIQ